MNMGRHDKLPSECRGDSGGSDRVKLRLTGNGTLQSLHMCLEGKGMKFAGTRLG